MDNDFHSLPLYHQTPYQKLLPPPSTQVLAQYRYKLILSWFPFLFILVLYAFFSFTYLPKFVASTLSANKRSTNSNQIVSAPIASPSGILVTSPVPSAVIRPSIPPKGNPSIKNPTPTGYNSNFIADTLVPVQFMIPKLNIKTAVEQVGQTKALNMDVPKNASHVAWYVYGAKPGEVGNAVINGHYDTPTGAPAIFYRLGQLVVGDEVKILAEDGVTRTFVVTGKETHPYESFPNEFVFHTRPGTNLNLITCSGIWDTKNKIYNNRLVIYTSLKN